MTGPASPDELPTPPPDVPALLRRLLDAGPGRPRLTWYGPDGERVELSAKVLDNWVAKTANLLVDELDAGPGTGVVIDLPGHWRTVVWALAVWAVGACAVLPGGGGQPVAEPGLPVAEPGLPVAEPGLPVAEPGLHLDVLVTDGRPGSTVGGVPGATVVAVALPALATTFGPGLPPGALDAAPAVRGSGDVFLPLVRPAAGDPALIAAGVRLVHGDLLPAAARAAADSGYRAGVRLLAGDGAYPVTGDQAITRWLAPLVANGSLVLHHELAAPDAAARERLAAQEAVTATAPRTQTPRTQAPRTPPVSPRT